MTVHLHGYHQYVLPLPTSPEIRPPEVQQHSGQSPLAAKPKSHLTSFTTVLSRDADLVSCSADLGTGNIH